LYLVYHKLRQANITRELTDMSIILREA